jgi:hypothetical protein
MCGGVPLISKYDRRIRKRYCRVVDHDIRVERATAYYYEILPRLFKIINTDASINSFTTYYEPYITDLSASATDISGIDLTWTGRFPRIFTGIQRAILTLATRLYLGLPRIIVGFVGYTQYYFRLKPYGETGYAYADSSSVSAFTDYIPL